MRHAFVLLVILGLAACEGARRPSADLARDSGVAGAGTGRSTRIASAKSPASTSGGNTDSTQSNQGAYAGGPH